MSRIFLSKNFFLDEYIPKSLYLRFEKTPQILFGLLDIRLIVSDQLLRDQFGSITINNWWHGGDRNSSGLRISGSQFYSATSQHAFGRASDKLFQVDEKIVKEYIILNWRSLGITAIEKNVGWVHSDCRYSPSQSLLIF